MDLDSYQQDSTSWSITDGFATMGELTFAADMYAWYADTTEHLTMDYSESLVDIDVNYISNFKAAWSSPVCTGSSQDMCLIGGETQTVNIRIELPGNDVDLQVEEYQFVIPEATDMYSEYYWDELETEESDYNEVLQFLVLYTSIIATVVGIGLAVMIATSSNP